MISIDKCKWREQIGLTSLRRESSGNLHEAEVNLFGGPGVQVEQVGLGDQEDRESVRSRGPLGPVGPHGPLKMGGDMRELSRERRTLLRIV